MATFRKHRGKWQAQIRRAGHPATSRSFELKEDALRWVRHQERLIDLGELSPAIGKAETSKLTVGELLARYCSEVLPKKRSAGPVERLHIKAVLRHGIARIEIRNITLASIGDYRDQRLRKVTGSTVRRELGLIQHAFNIARKEWGIPVPDLHDLSKPRANKARERRLTEEDLIKLEEGFSQCRNPLVKPTFLFALATGMRRGEILSLRWSHIDQKVNTAFLPMTKNGYSRTVPLSPMALSALPRRTPATRDHEFVFPISSNALKLSWERIRLRSDIKDLRFHDLRHEAISRFFEMGLSMPEVSLISGHRDPRMLFRYTHLRATDVAEKLRRLSESETPEAADPPEET
jgi:integrase